jgi:hypothetical protein
MKKLKYILIGLGVVGLFILMQWTSQNLEGFAVFWKTLIWTFAGVALALMFLFDRDRHFFGFLSAYYQFHVLGKNKTPQPIGWYRWYQKRLESLKKQSGGWWKMKKVKWEIDLISEMLEESGFFTRKMTGKNNHKPRYKLRLKGEKYKIK